MLSKEDLNNLFQKYGTSEKGLGETAIAAKKAEFGSNTITAKKKKPLILVFLEEFKDLMVVILIIAAALALVAGKTTDGTVIMFVVVLNAIIGFIQKYKAEKAVEALRKLIAPRARVLRNGKEEQIAAKDLVPGDILILSEGDSITADAILFEANELEAQEATLTGESMPVRKLTYDIEETKGLAAEKENIVFMGTNISHGSGKAIVIGTGMNTEMGKIAQLTTETKKDKSPLEKELHRIGIFVGKLSLIISAILLTIGYFIQRKDFIETLLFATSVAVAAVPEGLPATITIALAIGVQRLAKKNAIVKQLSASETLGSTTVICSDKTGTLTKNEMTVKEIYFNDHEESINSLNHFITGAALCNNANLKSENKKWQVLGDPTEGALLTMVTKYGFEIEKLKQKNEKVFEITFDSTRKLMTVIIKTKDGKYFAYTKGAPDSIIEISNRCMKNDEPANLTQEEKEKFHRKNEEMATRALRVLGIAYRELTPAEIEQFQKTKSFKKEDIEKNLIFLGLTGMIDPPRDGVKDAVLTAKKAHIRIYIITGDHGLTAQAIAKQLNIIDDRREHKIITGIELNDISDQDLKKYLSNKELDIIFARVSPEHKLRIVTILKELKEIVAVTGDGVNDAPALKKADIGIAMGITGTDVSKEAANMVLADDSFSTIVTAIKEGRTIYDNLKKFVFYMFSCNTGELFIVFAAIIMGLPAPLTAVLILAVDLGTDILPALALGVDPPEPGIMDAKPRNPNEKIMNRDFVIRFTYIGILIGAIVMGIYILTLYRYGWSWGQPLSDENEIHLKASSAAFALLIIIQMVQAFNARSDKNSVFKIGFLSNLHLLGAIIISLVFTFTMIENSFFQHYLKTTGLTLEDWGIIILASSIIFITEEIRKFFVRKKLATDLSTYND